MKTGPSSAQRPEERVARPVRDSTRRRSSVLQFCGTVWLGAATLLEGGAGCSPGDSRELEERGEQLAQIACAGCHVVPAPADLPRRDWEYTLPQMAWLLGLGLDFPGGAPGPREGFASYVVEHLQGKRASFEDRGLVLSQPVLDEADWSAIRAYYLNRAPERLELPAERRPAAGPEPQLERPSVEDHELQREPAPAERPARQPVPARASRLELFRPRPTDYSVPRPLTTLLRINEPARELWIGDSAWCESGCARTLTVLDSTGRRTLALEPQGDPIDVHFVDRGFVLTEIGAFFPYHIETDTPARLTRYRRSGASFDSSPLADGLPRIANTNRADVDGDGDDDFVVCAHGWGMVTIGHVSWLENREPEPYREHVLLHQPGCVRSEVADIDGDGRLDVLVLVAGAREGLYLLRGTGSARFEPETILERHPAFGFTHMQLADFDGDGSPDLVVVNGDDIDGHPDKLLRPYHGVRILLHRGGPVFEEAYFHHVRGACMASARDFDRDGDLDIAVVANLPDLSLDEPLGFVYLRNEGGLRFTPLTHPATNATRWLTLDGGDLDGDGDDEIVLGGFASPLGLAMYDPRVRQRLAQFQESGPSILVLENTVVP